MGTVLSIKDTSFFINDVITYHEIPECPPACQGLMMNARFIQGVFDDSENRNRFQRFDRTFDAEENTLELIAALPEWYAHGLRAITVGFQGGGPCFTINSNSIDNNPFSADGRHIDPAYQTRMQRIIEAADRLGMVVIVSYFYGPQSRFLQDDNAVIEAVKTVSNWLREHRFTNVIIEIANEHDIEAYKIHPILYMDRGISELIEIARRESGGMPVGCSSTGAYFSDIIPKASDVILIHGNNMSRQIFYNQIRKIKNLGLNRPILCNEDSQALSNMQVALDAGVSWGYYNNMTKQEPPVIWGITKGEDTYFAVRMAESLGIRANTMKPEEQFYLQGLEADACWEGKRFIRLASLYAERIDRVTFYRNNKRFCMAYDDPFSINYAFNWLQFPVEDIEKGEKWKAVITMTDGSEVIKETTAG